MFLFFVLLIILGDALPVAIPFRRFTTTARTLGGDGATPSNTSASYGALQFFIDSVASSTAALAGDQPVQFVVMQWPRASGCTLLQQVGGTGGSACPVQQAAFDSGVQLNPAVWGFLGQSGQPFGMPFGRFLGFLHSPLPGGNTTGLGLIQSFLDARQANVQVMPVLGAPLTSSGWLPLDLSQENNFAEACLADWTWRYDLPGQTVLDFACTSLAGTAKQLQFVANAEPGQPSFLAAVQAETVQAFDYGSALDTLEAFFPPPGGPATPPCSTLNPEPLCTQNPGQKGVRFVHYPAWQQPFFLGWMYINGNLWRSLSLAQQAAISAAAASATRASYVASYDTECAALAAMVAANANQMQVNPDGTPRDCNPGQGGSQPCSAQIEVRQINPTTLALLEQSTTQFLYSLMGETPDQQDYMTLLNALLDYQASTGYLWQASDFSPACTESRQ